MTKEELAKLLDGCEYGSELGCFDGRVVKACGLVVVYGASDDLMEFEGAICDEVDCYEGGSVLVDAKGLLTRDDDDDDETIAEYVKRRNAAREIEALWCAEGDYSWTYRTDIQHATFEIVEDGAPYCRGIVFALDEIYDTYRE
jgi:hypothetical protein